jgi:hypothetical protein
VLIRPITEADWPEFYPVFRDVVAAGATYAYPEELGSSAAHDLWELGFEVVGTVPEAFSSRSHGRVGLHVMHRHL